MSEKKGFIGSIFDLSFTEFVTTRIIKFIFVVAIIIAAIGSFALIVGGFMDGFFKGLVILIISPIIFLLYVLISRMWLEMTIVIFRIAENTGRLVEQNKAKESDQ